MTGSSIGHKRERITIQSSVETADAEGEPVDVWSTLAALPAGCWARAEFLSGRELEDMQKINAEVTLRFTVNYRTDIVEKNRVSWRSAFWNIHFVQPEEDKFDMNLLCGKVE